MTISELDIDKIIVRLAKDEAEIKAAQHLRYKVFYEEYAASATAEMAREERDFDKYDDYADHLVVIDQNIKDPLKSIIGTYRLLDQDAADKVGSFYSSDEFDISPLLNTGQAPLELGRSCVLAEYRTRPVLQLLWKGITDYMLDNDIGLMFGCASLHGTDISALHDQLSYLYHYHLAPADMRPRALDDVYVDMNLVPKEDINVRRVFNTLPPLIKGYLRLGASIGDGAYIDHQFNTIDVCIVLSMDGVAERYRKFYERKVERPVNIGEAKKRSQA